MALHSTAARSTRMSFKRWSVWLLLLVALVALTVQGVRAQEQPRASAAVVHEEIPEFEPTDEWQDIQPGQSIPPGLHVRLNLATGKREAKLLSEDDENSVAIAEPTAAHDEANAKQASVTVVTDVSGEIHDATVATAKPSANAVAVVETTSESEAALKTGQEVPTTDATLEELDEAPPAKEPNWNHEKIYEVLQALPEPPEVEGMDIHDAHAKLPKAEFRRQMIRLWKKRQEQLKEAIDTLQDDAKYLANLLDQCQEAEKNGDTAGMLRVLEVLEWEVQDLDKTHVFNFIGGFSVVTEYLNSTNLPVRASASWLIGTAVKNYKDGQDWAINAGAIPRLVDSLTLAVPTDDSERAAAVYEVKKKAVYGLSSLVRVNARGQRLLLSLDGASKLSTLMEDHSPLGVQLKAVLFVHDLVTEAPVDGPTGSDVSALPQLQDAFKTSPWCLHTANFLKKQAAKLQQNQLVEIIQAMDAQLPACQSAFANANVKASIETIQSTWQADATLEDDDREHLVAAGASILSKL